MIINFAVPRFSRNLTRIAFSYIKQRDIEQAENQYGSIGKLDKIRGKFAVVKLLCVQSFRDARSDYKRLKEIGKLKLEQRQYDEQRDYLRIKSDMLKAIPAFTILNAPGGAPFFFAYILLFPNLAPTWVLTESTFNALQLMKRQNRTAALYRFKRTIRTENTQILSKEIANLFISIKNGSYNNGNEVQILRDMASLLQGQYTDGTYYLCYYSPLKRIGFRLKYLIHTLLSRYLLTHKIQTIVDSNTFFAKDYAKLESLHDRLAFLLETQLNNFQKSQR